MRSTPFKGNVVVSNLPAQLSPADLADLFDAHGLVLGAKIDRWHDRPGGSQGLIDLAPDTSVEKAIAALDGQLVGGHKISVRRAPKREKKAASAMKRPAAKAAAAPSRPYVPAEGPTLRPVAAAGPVRKVVVEYRPAPRRVVVPPRNASPAGQ